MQFHFHANQSHSHKNGFALRLALKQRHKGIHQKIPFTNVVGSLVVVSLMIAHDGKKETVSRKNVHS